MAEDKTPNKVTVLLQTAEFRRFDAYCKSRGFKKSTLIARLVREHLDAERFTTKDQAHLAEANQS